LAVLHSYECAAELLVAGMLDPAMSIRDRLPLKKYPQALEQFAAGIGRKIQVLP
jgi:hypothetical protein